MVQLDRKDHKASRVIKEILDLRGHKVWLDLQALMVQQGHKVNVALMVCRDLLEYRVSKGFKVRQDRQLYLVMPIIQQR
jgi:hypothetical protein